MIAVAGKGEASVLPSGCDFGISKPYPQRWLKIADQDDGLAPPAAGDRGSGEQPESVEMRESRRGNKLLRQENEILARAIAYFVRDVLPRMIYPPVRELAVEKIPSR